MRRMILWREATLLCVTHDISETQAFERVLNEVEQLQMQNAMLQVVARSVDVPLASTFTLSTKPGKEAYVELFDFWTRALIDVRTLTNYEDGVYLARPAMVLADFVDLDRVEVLRGPQGTLYGRNAVGGALNILTKLPSDTFLWAAITAIGASATLQMMGKQSASVFVGQWAPTLLILGLYNKLVKQHGSDFTDTRA